MKGASRVKGGLALLAALLVGLFTDWWQRQPPERFFAAKTVTLDTSRADHDRGRAYWVSLRWIAHGLTSDQSGVSPLELFEDGNRLEGHALHSEIRQEGGLFSHWGRAVLFSARDGSDPRTNGRRYDVRLPPLYPAWHWPAQIGLFAAAVVSLIVGFYAVSGGSVRSAFVLTLGTGVALAGIAFGGAQLSPQVRELGEIEAAISEETGFSVTEERLEPMEWRTRHLLRGAEAVAFTTEAPPVEAPPPRRIELDLVGGTPRGRGFVELGEGVALRNLQPLEIAGSDLELLVLEVEALEDTSIVLSLVTRDDLKDPGVVLLCPVRASAGLQTVRFRRPALGPVGELRYVTLHKDPTDSRNPVVRVRSLRYSLRLDAFSLQHSGFDPVEHGGSLRPTLWQSVPGRSSLPVREGDGSWLKLAVGALSDSADPVAFAVSAVDASGQSSVLERGAVHPREGWRELALSLPDGTRELRLEGERLPARSALLWSGARLIDRRRPPRRMVLIVADTLRADALGSYGHPGDPTPAIDALARRGVRFERVFAQSYWTRPSMASMMTGHYEGSTGVRTLYDRLPEAYETLAELLSQGGFTTVGIVTNGNAGPSAGLDQGFDRVRTMMSMSRATIEDSSRLISEVVLPVIEDVEEDDVFLYLHLMEVHGPYGPLEPPDSGLVLPEGGVPLLFDPLYDRSWNPSPTREQRIALYEYDVSSLDRGLAVLFDELDRRWDSADGPAPVVAFVSDHGEHLGEGGQWGHDFADLYPVNVQVPMIIRAPGQIDPDTVWPDPVEARRLGATLLDLAGLVPRSAASGQAGQSLLFLLEGAAPSSLLPFAISSGQVEERSAFSLFGREYSYVARFVGESPRLALHEGAELGDPVTDRWERLGLERAFLRLWGSHRRLQAGVREALWPDQEATLTLDPAELEALRALGYVE